MRGTSGHVSTTEQTKSVYDAIREDNLELAHVMIDAPNKEDAAGHTLLFHAIQSESLEIVQMLLKKRADPELGCTQEGSRLAGLHYARDRKSVV